jgi:hypothetical protein
MSEKSSSGFAGLIVEGAVIGLVVALLPKLPLGPLTEGVQAASERPRLAGQPADFSMPRLSLPVPPANWRTAVSRPETTLMPPPADTVAADPKYVERRLDDAGQRLVSGLGSYLARHAEQVLSNPPEAKPASPGSFPTTIAPRMPAATRNLTPPVNSFRYGS